MFSVIFPGQGSQIWNGKRIFEKFDTVKNLFKQADDILEFQFV